MTDTPPPPPEKPQSPWRLNQARIIILILGALVLVYALSTIFGGLGNYEQLKEAASDAAAGKPATEAKP